MVQFYGTQTYHYKGTALYVSFILACSGEYCTQQNVQVNSTTFYNPYLKIYTKPV